MVVANDTLTATTSHADGTTTLDWTSRDPIASYPFAFHAGNLDLESFTCSDGLPYTLAFAAGTPEVQRETFRRLPEIMEIFTGLFDPDSFESASAIVVGTPIPFALERQTLRTYGVVIEIPGQPFLPKITDAYMETVAHELAQQWFGDSVSVLRWQHVWLNEGVATYPQMLWLEKLQGPIVRAASLTDLRARAESPQAYAVPE